MTCYNIVSDCHAFLSDLRVQGTVVGFFSLFISRTVGGLTVGLLTVQVPYLYYKQPGRIGSSFVLGRTAESLVRRTSDLLAIVVGPITSDPILGIRVWDTFGYECDHFWFFWFGIDIMGSRGFTFT